MGDCFAGKLDRNLVKVKMPGSSVGRCSYRGSVVCQHISGRQEHIAAIGIIRVPSRYYNIVRAKLTQRAAVRRIDSPRRISGTSRWRKQRLPIGFLGKVFSSHNVIL